MKILAKTYGHGDISQGFEKQSTKEVKMAGKFEVYKDAKGEFRFRLKAGNGEVIAVGEGYTSKAGCLNGIESIRKNAPEAKMVDLTEETK
jgi:uncharacterized protein YegP (UPF0339 family)